MQCLPVPSQLTATYADSETALQGPAKVFKILTIINFNGFLGLEREIDRQTNDLKLRQTEMVPERAEETRLIPGITLH